MSNMSYCRFQNTLSDLQDCIETLRNRETIGSSEERQAAEQMISLMAPFLREESLINEETGEANDDAVASLLKQCPED